MLVVLVGILAGLLLDHRTITDAPAWLKPAKFAISVAIYSGTLAWVLGKVTAWPRAAEFLWNSTAGALLLEIFIIDLQAWRGTTSHFNFQTPLDSLLFAVMGVSIAILWLASLGVAVLLVWQHFTNPILGLALRLGMIITVLGSASGGVMTHPMPGQRAGTIGSHTVGAPDGGAGMPGTGWSAEHGDLRIGHFVGLHGLQAIPLLYWLLSRKRRAGAGAIWIGAGAYLSAVFILEWQALRGQSLLQPDTVTLSAWAGWALACAGAAFLYAILTPGRFSKATARVA